MKIPKILNNYNYSVIFQKSLSELVRDRDGLEYDISTTLLERKLRTESVEIFYNEICKLIEEKK